MADEIIFPDPTKRYVKALRFANLLDDAHNAISWTKVHVLCANIAGFSSVLTLILAWITAHENILKDALDVLPATMTYLSHAHAMHLLDKGQRNKTAIELAKAAK